MTSKEALSDLSFLAIGDENHTIKCKEVIEKDLEVLEILKRKSVDIFLIKDIMLDKIKFDCYPYDNLTNEEFNKIKEWLENE